MPKIIKRGSNGKDVSDWQVFLRDQGFAIQVTGLFTDDTDLATKSFQANHGLKADGLVGPKTLETAVQLGMGVSAPAPVEPVAFPATPAFQPLVSNASRQAQFGPLEFIGAPTADNLEAIRITNGWERDNIVRVSIPQLIGISGARADGTVRFHRKAAGQLQAMFVDWEQAGVLHLLLTFDGTYNPRFVRGGADRGVLSNHAFGTAVDLNAEWNSLGDPPARPDQRGCVYPLVGIANRHGFYWGGHFSRPDGMHFETARIL
jgi:hypothetical protein